MSKKAKRIILICVGAVVLVFVAAVLINFLPMLGMAPAETGGIAETGIIAVRNNLNSVYFIKSEGGYIAIDAGTNKSGLEKALDELSIDPADVTHVLLTHSDNDHVGSLELFANARLHMSEDELQMVNGSVKRSPLGHNSLPKSVRNDSATLLSDEQELNLDGLLIRCIKTPGHTPGSMSYLVEGKYLFSGDALRINDNRMSIHPFTMDEREAAKSIERLGKEKDACSLLLSAHYGYYLPRDIE